jgi:proline iminopeptidase
MARRFRAAVPLLALAVGAAGCIDPSAPGTLVPPTADQDPKLPGVNIAYQGASRRIHYREFGDASRPVLFIIPGSGSDVRPYLPLQVLADAYRVIMWDLPGNGLSERVSASEVEVEKQVEAIEALRQQFSPDRPVTILGHSWSAATVALYLAAHPDVVHQAVLIEPPGLKAEFQQQVGLAADLTAPGYLEMVWNSESMPVNHEGLDYQMLALSQSGIRRFACPGKPNPPWPIWRPGALANIVWERSIVSGTTFIHDYTRGLDRFIHEVLIVGTECSPIGTDFQRRTNLTVFPNAKLLHIPNSSHRILTEQLDMLLTGLRGFLDPAGVPQAGAAP